MPQTLTIDFPQPIPLFPLPRCVLLPHASVPLHIFESRYRKMTCDALDSRGLIAMATLGHGEPDDVGTPPIRPCVCVGYILQHHRLDDGRYNLLLHGICRAQIKAETDHSPYRTAYLQPIEPGNTLEIDLDDERQRMQGLFDDEHVGRLAAIASIRRWLINS